MANVRCRVDSTFSFLELGSDLSEVKVIYARDLPEPKYKVVYGSPVLINILGINRYYNITDDIMRKIPHESTHNLLDGTSDVRLSSIGVCGDNGRLSPDTINTDSQIVIELSTDASDDEKVMMSSYQSKIRKYNYLVEPLGYKMAAIVVSRNKVLTNLSISQDVVDSLVYRYRTGSAIRASLMEQSGVNLGSDDWSELEERCKTVLSSITGMPESTSKFPIDVILSGASGPSKEDARHMSEALGLALEQSRHKSGETEILIKEYEDGFLNQSKVSDKRVCNIPMILPDLSSAERPFLDPESSDMPAWLKTIWCTAREHSFKVDSTLSKLSDKTLAMSEALGMTDFQRHRVQSTQAFNCHLSEDERLEAAKSGVFAKAYKDHPEIKKKDDESHLSFSPVYSNTKDIEDFIKKDLTSCTESSVSIPATIWKMIKSAKQMYNDDPLSMTILELLCRSKISHFASVISELFTEICYTYKYWIKRSDFYHKQHKGVHMLIRCTGDHTFVSYAYPRATSEILDTGRIGPVIYESDNFYFTKFSSYNEPTVEHFVKAGPYLTSILMHLLSHFEVNLTDCANLPEQLKQTMNNILLLYLNNKTDAEELVTSQRYLTMNILEEVDPNPYRFVSRLPEVFRSRLTVHLYRETKKIMLYYASRKIHKEKVGIEDDESYEYRGLRSLFCDGEVTLKQKINEFYFGYVVSKERGRGSDRNFKIMKKIVAEEYRFRDTVQRTFEVSLNPKIHVSNPAVIRVMLHMFRAILKRNIGKDWRYIVEEAIIKDWARKSFQEIATMKVSSRTYKETILVNPEVEGKSTSEIKAMLTADNPNEVKRRPRVMEALKWLIEEFIEQGGQSPEHPVDLLTYCLSSIEKTGYWDSDIFPKPQHGGDREIHVLSIKMRIVQLFLESISRTLCHFCPSDTLVHPKLKESFVRNHYRTIATDHTSTFVTLGKSADATKWCQRHHSSKFAMILVGITGSQFWSFIVRVMWLWQKKRISFPIQFAANFMSNEKTASNKVYERMRGEFFTGSGIFKEAYNTKIHVESGMMQGILHYTSSITHGVLQEVMKTVQQSWLTKHKIRSTITIVQGSDDSAELITLSGGKSIHLIQIATMMLNWKENMGPHLSIYTSRAKSSIGTLDMVEYNSEWCIKSTSIKPTFRWVSSCLETGIVEKFIDRYQNMNGSITSVLEGGGKLLEAAVIQECQAWMHYMLLGFHTSIVADEAGTMLQAIKDPSLGFFPLDSDYCAGIPGVNFLLYVLYQRSPYGRGLGRTMIKDVELDFFEDDTRDPSISKDLRKVRIRFGDHKIFHRILRDMDVPALESLAEEVEKDPGLLYQPRSEWSSSKFKIFLKIFEPGVKESLSRHSSTARLMSASAYMLTRQCLTDSRDFNPESSDPLPKYSLFHLIYSEYSNSSHRPKIGSDLVFLHSKEFQELLSYIDKLEQDSILKPQHLRTRSKQSIMVFEEELSGPSLIDMCKEKWFGIANTRLSRRQFASRWQELKNIYVFLDDDRTVTKANLRMNEIQMKNFLESQSEKTRSITLMDTSAKSSNIQSSITRIFWCNTKILLPRELNDDESSFSIRSKIFSILTSWYSATSSKKMIQEILTRSPMLAHQRVPNRLVKLKMIRDWLIDRENSKDAVARQILDKKVGSVGFFTIRQEGYGKNRKGFGEWKGNVLNSRVCIQMMDTVCTKIIVDKLLDPRDLGYALQTLISNFSLNISDKLHSSDYWLTSKGRIVTGTGFRASTPIEIDPTFDVSIIDNLSLYPWDWELDQSRIKLVVYYETDVKMVILSETLTSRDWEPSHHLESPIDLHCWSKGEELSLNVLQNEFSSLINSSVAKMNKLLNAEYGTKFTSNGWSVKKFAERVRYLYCIDAKAKPEDDSSSSISISKEEMDEMMLFMIDNQAEIDIPLEDLRQEDTQMDLFSVGLGNIDEVQAQLDILLGDGNPNHRVNYNYYDMPLTNRCLAGLDVLCRAQTGMSLSEAYLEFNQKSNLMTYGLIGFILSLLTKRNCMKFAYSAAEHEISRDESDSVSFLTSIRSEEDLDELSEEELIQTIDYHRGTLIGAPSRLIPRIRATIHRYEVALRSLRMVEDTQDEIEESKSNKTIYSLKDYLQPYLERRFSKVSSHKDLYCQQVRMLLDEKLDDMLNTGTISPLEHGLYRESVSKSYTTPLLIDVLSVVFDLSLKCGNYIRSIGTDIITIS